MRIGIISPLNISYFSHFFSDDQAKKIIEKNATDAVATAVHTLVQSLLEDGNFIRIFTLAESPFSIKGDNIEIYGVQKFDRYPVKYLWGNFIDGNNLKKKLKDHISDIEVLHAHWTYSCAYAASSFTNDIPVFCTVRDWAAYIWKIESTKNKVTWTFRYVMNRLVFKNRDIHFISNSPYTADKIEKAYGIKAPVIPNPIIESFLNYDEPIVPSNLELLCISSSHDKRKNVKTLLHAFQTILTNYPDAHLTLVGAPFCEENENMKPLRSLGLLKNVTLIGPVKHNDLKYYIDRARIFISPSLEETFGNTLLESMARKIPIVAGENSGAIPYVLHQGKAGYLCDVSKANEIEKKIIYVFENPDKAAVVVEYAFNILLSDYIGEKVKNRHIELYKDCLQKEVRENNICPPL